MMIKYPHSPRSNKQSLIFGRFNMVARAVSLRELLRCPHSPRSNKQSLIFALVLTLFVGGCGVAIVPKPDQTGEVDLHSNIITKKVGGAAVSVQTQEWQFYPGDLEQYYTPLLLLIKNGTENKLEFAQKFLNLLDSGGNQFQPVPPVEVERTFIDRGYPVSSSAHIGIGSGGYSSFFGFAFNFPFYPSPPPVSDISLLALHEGDILPGATVRGFVYFRKVVPTEGTLKLHLEINQAAEDFYFIVKR
ncbi:MAG: hypothetical protein HY036_05390 [Nitrospirae bacterium]|nr:hypothetical protein [Nitrospirota bacterium]MBI3351995.1 hypothetical protein [Nitrospirota bacterium]